MFKPSMSNEIHIEALARRPAEVTRFLEVSYSIYDGDPHWVAPLLMDLKKVFTDENPMFEHAQMQLWVARQGGRDVGRMAGIIDDYYNRANQEPAAFFGFFESTQNADVSRSLFAAVREWARQKGM